MVSTKDHTGGRLASFGDYNKHCYWEYLKW
jgi:hypothetical protein